MLPNRLTRTPILLYHHLTPILTLTALLYPYLRMETQALPPPARHRQQHSRRQVSLYPPAQVRQQVCTAHRIPPTELITDHVLSLLLRDRHLRLIANNWLWLRLRQRRELWRVVCAHVERGLDTLRHAVGHCCDARRGVAWLCAAPPPSRFRACIFILPWTT